MALPSILFIDWFQTISWSLFWTEWRTDGTEMEQRLAKIKDQFFAEEKERIRLWMRGQESAESICATLAARSGIPVDLVFKELERTCREMCLIPNAREEILRIRALGVTVFLVTDNMDTFSRWSVPALQLDQLVNGIFSSDQTGILKNDRTENNESKIFAQILKQQQKTWSDAFLIDDSGERYAEHATKGLRIAVPRTPEETIEILRTIR